MQGRFSPNLIVKLLAAAALAVSVYLAALSIAGKVSGPGCGGGGCEHVLSSHWSKLLNVPVALFAVGIYGAMSLLLLLPTSRDDTRWFTPRQGMLAILAATAGSAAVWFTFLQFIIIGKVCPLCMTAHVCGGAVSAAILYRLTQAHRSRILRHVAIGTSAVVLTIVIQVMFPSRTAGVFRGGVAGGHDADPTRYVVNIGQGQIQLNPQELPILGAADADQLLLLLYDYTCPHCRRMHTFLQAAEARYGDQLGVVLLPVPLDSDCNADIVDTEPRHENACDYAQLALATWRHGRERFAKLDRWLSEGNEPPPLAEAQAYAAELLGAEELASAMADVWPGEQITRNVGLHRALSAAMGGGGGLPMLLSGGVLVAGRTHDAEELFALLEAELGMTPVLTNP